MSDRDWRPGNPVYDDLREEEVDMKLVKAHSIYDRKRFWDSRTWKRVECCGEGCEYCADGWQVEGVIVVRR